LQKALARELTVFVHGDEEYKKAIETTEKLFANMSAPAESLSEDDLKSMDGIVKTNLQSNFVLENDLITILVECKIFASKGEARKMIQQGGLSLNRHKINDPSMKISTDNLLHSKYLLIQKGKKNYYLIEAE
jgi:tyrosyl-tRNA synthetase